jgi:hypothetical protein
MVNQSLLKFNHILFDACFEGSPSQFFHLSTTICGSAEMAKECRIT